MELCTALKEVIDTEPSVVSNSDTHLLCEVPFEDSQLLSSEYHLRSEHIVETIAAQLRPYSFFGKHKNKLDECARSFQLAEFASGESITEYNSDPQEFFFLLEGEALVLLRKTTPELEADKELMRRLGSQHWRSLQPAQQKLLKNHHFQGEVCKFKQVSQLKKGATFGELGIIYNKPRIALIVAKSPCRLAMLKKEDYLRIFCETQNQERKNKREFIFSHFFGRFRELKYETCQSILYAFRQRRYIINEIICREGQPFPGLILLKNGEVTLSQNHHRKRLISIVTRGYLLCEREWKKTLESDTLCNLTYTARVSSSEAWVYYMEWEEMQKIFNFKSILKELSESLSYMEYLEQRREQDKQNSPPKDLPEELKKQQEENQFRKLSNMKQQILKERRLISELKQAMLGSLMCCETKSKPIVRRSILRNSTSRMTPVLPQFGQSPQPRGKHRITTSMVPYT